MGSPNTPEEKMERRESTAGRRKCNLQKLPSELIMMAMHHMDEESLKSFVQTHRAGYAIWKAGTLGIFLGMQETQLPEVSRIFGGPNAASVEQRQIMEDALYTCGKRSAHSKAGLIEGTWWEHLANLRILQEDLDMQMQHLHHWTEDELLDTASFRKAGRLIWLTFLGPRRKNVAAQAVEERVRMFLEQPAEVQHQALEILQSLCKTVDNSFQMTLNFGAWATEEGRIEKKGSDAEWTLKQWISKRIIAATLNLSSILGIHGCNMLLAEPKSADMLQWLENIRVNTLLWLNAEEQYGPSTWSMLAQRLSRGIGLEHIALAYTNASLQAGMIMGEEQ